MREKGEKTRRETEQIQKGRKGEFGRRERDRAGQAEKRKRG
jgi:hypothetical protein